MCEGKNNYFMIFVLMVRNYKTVLVVRRSLILVIIKYGKSVLEMREYGKFESYF